MSDQAQEFQQGATLGEQSAGSSDHWTLKDFLWAVPQPILVVGSMLLVATMISEQ